MMGRILVAMVVASVEIASAQSTGAAESLFRDGKRLMAEGKYAEACRALDSSERLEHNLSTLMNLGFCREKEGRLATAWGIYIRVELLTRDPAQTALNTSAKKRAAEIEPRLSYLTINVSDANRVPDLVIRRGELTIDSAEWNSAIPVDGGEHVIAGKAPGHEEWSTTVTLGERERKSVDVPRFKAIVDLAPELPEPEPVEPAPVVVPETSAFTTRRKVALVVGGGGVVIGGIAIGLGLSASGLRDDALARCPAVGCSVDDASAAQRDNDRARDRALYANIGFGVAGVAVVGAAVLWLTGAPETPSRVTVTPMLGDSTGIAIGGAL